MTRHEFDALTKRNHGTWLSPRHLLSYKIERLHRRPGFPMERDLLADRADFKRMSEECWGVIGTLFDRHLHARSRFRALKACGHSDGGLYA